MIRTSIYNCSYSRVPNKRGDGNNQGGLEIVRYSNNRGVGIIGGGGFLEK